MEQARYIVGIDLGTTNCVVAYIDTHNNAGGTENKAEDEKGRESILFTIP
ncbi:hypothetical protein MBAV_006367, partial [Candidatus Magnetobacterium bavaricum]